jgi:hypothetical protein
MICGYCHDGRCTLHPGGKCREPCPHGYDPNKCALGFPGCVCADELESELEDWEGESMQEGDMEA